MVQDLRGKMDDFEPRHKMALIEKAEVIRRNKLLQAQLAKSAKGTELLQVLATAQTKIEKLAVMKAIAEYQETRSVLLENNLEMSVPQFTVGDNEEEN